ncbi:MAG: prepilin-type N-terminal cleavage/methylation domain-containing protein [Nitrosomonadales bacterium]|nr:prepilin-type N-terminal cleavage/methylation domain-containing protein [Nitrosomonadales bacterium]
MKPDRIGGFSLIELMIAVIIVGILAAIAMPSYSNYVIRGSRAAAQTELLDLASLQEKIYLNSNCYTSSVTMTYNGTSAINNCTASPVVTTGGLGRTTGLTNDGKYTLSITTSGTQQTYTITATPVAGSKQAGNGCLTIQENGLRQWHENNDACNSASPVSW